MHILYRLMELYSNVMSIAVPAGLTLGIICTIFAGFYACWKHEHGPFSECSPECKDK